MKVINSFMLLHYLNDDEIIHNAADNLKYNFIDAMSLSYYATTSDFRELGRVKFYTSCSCIK